MMAESIQVWRGAHGDPEHLFGPLPGFREDGVVAYEFELPERFEPWPGRTRLERTFVLLDVGVSFANPCWQRAIHHDGSVVETDPMGRNSWYADLITVQTVGNHSHVFRDLYLDVIVPTDGRYYRMLDLDEFGGRWRPGDYHSARLPTAYDGGKCFWIDTCTAAVGHLLNGPIFPQRACADWRISRHHSEIR
jgi:Protein of unknown function (DUF402)